MSSKKSLPPDHPCSLIFLDETGSVSGDRFFAIGALKLVIPSEMLRAVTKYRSQKRFFDEFHFGGMRRMDQDLYRGLADIVLNQGQSSFYMFIADRKVHDPVERFGNQWDAYLKMAEQLIVALIRPHEIATVLADSYTTPDHVLFEEQLKDNVNHRLRRLAVANVARLDSRSSDGIQAVDLLTSAAAFEFRASVGLASTSNHKALLAAYIRTRMGTSSVLDGFRSPDGRFSLAVYQHKEAQTPLPGTSTSLET